MRTLSWVLLTALGACVDLPSPRPHPSRARPSVKAKSVRTPKRVDPFGDALLRILLYDEQTGGALGNTTTALFIAERFHAILAATEELAPMGGTGEGRLSLSEDKFVTYCESRKGKVAFLVRVPRLESYGGAAHDALLERAWATASRVVEDVCPECQVAVGLRGSVRFGAVATGAAGSETPSIETGRAVSDTGLRRFFTGPVQYDSMSDLEVRLLVEELRAEAADARLEAVLALGRHVGSIGAAVPELVRLLEADPSKEVRVEIIRVLAAKEGERAVEPLEHALELGQWYATMNAAAEGLVQCGGRGREALLQQYRSSVWARHHILAAVESLGEGARDHLPLLREAAGAEGSPRVAISALRTIGLLRDVDSVPVLIAALDHSSPVVRTAATKSLAAMGRDAGAAVDALERLRERIEDSRARQDVGEALEAIRGGADRPELEGEGEGEGESES